MQIKTTVKFHFTHVRMSYIIKDRISIGKGVGVKEPFYTADGNKSYVNLYENGMEIHQNTRHGPTLLLNSVFPGDLSKEDRKHLSNAMKSIHSSNPYNNPHKEATLKLSDRWLRKLEK